MIEEDNAKLASRIEQLEEQVASLKGAVKALSVSFSGQGNALSRTSLDSALRDLGTRIKNGRPNRTYFNIRFRDYEAVVSNIRMMGSVIGRQFASTGLSRNVQSPGDMRLKSKTCTQADMESDWAAFWTKEMKLPSTYNRKRWEFAYIAQALWSEGKIGKGNRGLGFGCGIEPLPSLFVKYGASVLATDLDPNDPKSEAWAASKQLSTTVDALRRPAICPDPSLLANIIFKPQNMKNIDTDLYGKFDFCWSACALEHLGGIDEGLEFVRNSLRVLKPGGVAVHTTEYTFDPAGASETGASVYYRAAHLKDFSDRLSAEGYTVAEWDLSAGDGILDQFIDFPKKKDMFLTNRSPPLHLKINCDGSVCTSVGIIITASSI